MSRIRIGGVAKTSKGVKLRILLRGAGGESTLRPEVPLEEYLALGSPGEGALLSEEELRRIAGEVEDMACRERACRILACADNSRRALAEKLLLRGFSKAAVEAALCYASERGYLKEEAQIARYVELGMQKFYPRRRLFAALLRKGYPDKAIRAALDAADYRDSRVKAALLAAKEPVGKEETERLLLKHGFLPD